MSQTNGAYAFVNQVNMYYEIHFTDINETQIKSIKAKTLIVAGDRDVVTPGNAVEMSRQIIDSRLLIVPGDHGAFIGEICSLKGNADQQYPTVDLIEQFLKE